MPKNPQTDQPDDGDQPETTTAMLEVDLLGRTWRVPADNREWDFEAVEALEKGQLMAFLRIVLGPRQAALFATGGKRTAGDARDLVDAILLAVAEARAGE